VIWSWNVPWSTVLTLTVTPLFFWNVSTMLAKTFFGTASE